MREIVKGPLAWEVVHPAKTAGRLSGALPHMHNRTIGARTRALPTQLRSGSYYADRSHFEAGETRWRLTGIGGRRSVPGMTVKLVVLYTHPDDPDVFDRHYFDTHAPLVKVIPGLQRFETGRLVGAPDGGEQPYHRVAELYFADQAALEAAFGTDEGKAAAADYQQIAPPGSRMFAQALDD